MITHQLWTPDGADKYPSIEDEIEELHFGTMAGVGFSVCSWKMKRSPRYYYPDLRPTTLVKIKDGRKIAWEGEIINPGIEIQDAFEMPVECDGTGYRLATRWSEASLGQGDSGSDWIIAELLADDDLDYEEGRVDTDDFEFPTGIDFSPRVYYSDALERINKANGWFYGVWEGRKFYFHPFADSAEYEVAIEDAKYSLNFSIEEIKNYLGVSHAEDGSNLNYFNWPAGGPDLTSKGLYRRRDGILAFQGPVGLAEAEQSATVALDELKRMRPKTSFKVTKVTDIATGTEVPKALVRAGPIIHIKDLYPGRLSRADQQLVNELSTFALMQTDCEVTDIGEGDVELTISPGTMGQMMEIMLARTEARQAR